MEKTTALRERYPEFLNRSKKEKMKIGTHNGVFHADDIFGTAALRVLYPGAEVVRSRTPALLAECDVRIDVGGEYSPEKNTYDHHQRGGAGVRPTGVPYAGFGLIWRHFGAAICGGQDVADTVEETLVLGIDAVDNGYPLSTPLYEGVCGYSISSAISAFNPSWQEEESDWDEAFERAVQVASLILDREITRAQGVVLARKGVRAAIDGAVDPRLIVLERFMPWQDELLSGDGTPQALFVVFPSETGDWRLQCIPPLAGSFEKRLPLPESWAGKRADLATLTGVADSLFCHPGRFICGAQSREGVLALAELALQESPILDRDTESRR